MARLQEDVYCTLLMSDSYLPGAAVLSHSLRDAGTKKKLAVLITLDTLSADTIGQLKTLYDYLIPVDRIRNPNTANLYLMGRPDLSFAFTKIALWRQTQFRKIVYLDADVVALRSLDELFDIEATFAAAPDIGWPDAFNSGVMVLNPDMGEFWALQTMAATGDSFDGADQGLLNQYFEHRPYQRLKFTYNCTPNAEYQWEPAYRYHKRDISAVHFIGKTKPWSASHAGGSGVYGELLARWWAVHNRHLPQAIASRSSAAGQQQVTTNSGLGSASVPTIVEPPMIKPGEPTPTVKQRQFSAPLLAWDATKAEPPRQSRPEAANFPSEQYTFSESRELFKAPSKYAEPPKGMWYQVPESKPTQAEKPTPIFPWERETERPKPTRVFAEDIPPSPTPEPLAPTHPFSTVHYEEIPAREQTPSPPQESTNDTWQSFQQRNTNAWDSVPGIESYVRAIVDARDGKQRDKISALKQAMGTEDLDSPLMERRNRRESLIITDFPSAVERPSLPVTPAAVRRPTFWGEERDEAGQLPAAEGVPDQVNWNPDVKLEQLRRSSLIEIEHLKNDEHPNPPLRALPEHSVLENDGTKQQTKNASNITGGIATTDFVSTPPNTGSGQAQFSIQTQSQAGLSSDGFFVSNTQNSSSSSYEQSTSKSDSQQVAAGKMTFNIPEFGHDGKTVETETREKVLSSTQSNTNEAIGEGDGLF